MELIPVTTRILQPPQDDLLAALDESLPTLHEQDVVLISSKVVAISEGNCVPIEGTDKQALIEAEADLLIPREYWSSPLTVTRNAFIGTAGIDESNANGHYVLLPKDPFLSAATIRTHLRQSLQLNELGVVIVDSHSTPLRRGATGIAIGWAGFEPLISHVGKPDLFGRPLQIEVSNVVDGLAAGANVVMGETNECQPVVIVRQVPGLRFGENTMRTETLVPFAEDTFRVLYEQWLDK